MRPPCLMALSAFLAAAVLCGSSPCRAQSPKEKQPLGESNWSLFERVYGLVLRDYVEQKTPEDVIQGALKGAASAGGPECAYIPPDKVPAYRALSAPSPTLPLYVTKDEDFARVLAVFPGQEKAVKVGDALRFMGSVSTYDLSYPEVLEALRGKDEEKVRCIFLKQEAWQSYDATLARQPYAPPAWTPLPKEGGALAVPCLESPLPPALAQALKASKGPVLVDLRGCASGDTDAALRWAGDLLGKREGPAWKGQQDARHAPLSGPGYLAGREIRVLVSGSTARAGEVLALALMGSGAILVGEPTFGHAPLIQDFPLENGGILRLITAYFLNPDGKPVKGEPLKPAIPLTVAADEKAEETYAKALKAVVPPPAPPAKEAANEPKKP